MRTRSMVIRATNWQLLFLYQIRCVQDRNLWYIFQTLFAQKRGVVLPCFLYELESFQQCLSYDLRQIATFSVFEVRFFERVRFLRNPFFLRYRVQVWARFLEDARKRYFWAFAKQDGQKEIFPTKCFTWLFRSLLQRLKLLMGTSQKW